MNKIFESSDYSQFKYLAGNRKVNELHIKRLVKSIGTKNLMKANPIIVNENKEILDGQHRFEACKELCCPIYYTIATNSRVLQDVILLNSTSKNWTLWDYANSHAALGSKPYISLIKFCKECDVSIPVGLLLLTAKEFRENNSRLISPVQMFKAGKLEINITNLIEGKKLVSQAYDYRPYCKSYLTSRFVKALLQLQLQKDYNHSSFMERVGTYTVEVVIPSCKDPKEYIRHIEDLYNKSQRSKVRLY